MACSSSLRAQPGRQIIGVAKLQQRLPQRLDPLQGKGANAGELVRAELTAPAPEETQGEIKLAFLAALLPAFLSALLPAFLAAFLAALFSTFLPALAKDLAVRHALSEILKRDTVYGADLRDGPCCEGCQQGGGGSSSTWPIRWLTSRHWDREKLLNRQLCQDNANKMIAR